MSTRAEQFRRFVPRRERVEWRAGWWKDSEAGCRARGEQRRAGDIETRTVTDKPSVNYKLLRDVPRLRKAPRYSLNRGADKAVRWNAKGCTREGAQHDHANGAALRKVFARESMFKACRSLIYLYSTFIHLIFSENSRRSTDNLTKWRRTVPTIRIIYDVHNKIS